MSRLEVADQFVERARATQNNSDLGRLLEDASAEIGFRHFALIHHVDLRRASPHIIHLDNYPESWASHFIENGLYAEDPIHQACLTSNVGFTWANVPRMIAITSRQRSILESATLHGLGDGYTVPTNIPGESSGSCSFATRRGLSLPEENLLLAHLIGEFAFEAARRLNQTDLFPRRNPPRLTPRQRDCLLLAIHGKTDWEISRILGLSEETVTRHLNMARERYGVTKRLPLAVHAIFDGQISFLEALSQVLLLKE
jgi:LuxR family quorum-sensing system transcriptional regulator CciR